MNRLRVIFDRGLTAANVVDRICDAHPDSPLIHLSSPLPYRLLGSTQITGRQLLPFVNRLGNALLGAGMNRHDRVAVWKDNSVDYIFFALAIIKAGGIAVPINGGMGPAELRRYLEYTGSQIVITDAKHLAQAPERFPMVQTFLVTGATEGLAAPHLDINAALESASDQLSPAALHPDSDILIVHTSGTTGFPKGVLTSSGSLVAGIKGHYKVEPVSTRTRTAVAAPFNHLVCHVGLFSAMLGNLPVWPIGRFDAAQALDLIEREKITAFFGFPDVYLQLLESLEGRDLSSVQVWISTADAAHQAHMREFTQAGALVKLFGRRVVRSLFVDVLGTSEVGFAALTRMTFAARSGPPRRMVGIPSYAGPRVKVADPDGRPLRPGQIGRLMVKGQTLFKGYWNRRDALQGVHGDGWWWTGDIGYRDRWGRYYQLDRAADIVHTSRGPFYTLMAEEVLLGHPGVAEAVVFGLEHPVQGPAPFALVVPRCGRAVDPDEVRQWVNARLSAPAGIEAVHVATHQDVPRGLTGKVLKRALRDRYAGWFAQQGAPDQVAS